MHAAAVPCTYPGRCRALPCSYSWEYGSTAGLDTGSQGTDAEAGAGSPAGCFLLALCDFLNWHSAGNNTHSCDVLPAELSVRTAAFSVLMFTRVWKFWWDGVAFSTSAVHFLSLAFSIFSGKLDYNKLTLSAPLLYGLFTHSGWDLI